jgi:hypothetical protein
MQLSWSKGSLGLGFPDGRRTESSSKVSFSPYGQREISVLSELALGDGREDNRSIGFSRVVMSAPDYTEVCSYAGQFTLAPDKLISGSIKNHQQEERTLPGAYADVSNLIHVTINPTCRYWNIDQSLFRSEVFHEKRH